MCSSARAALARIISAIDQLASDGGSDADAGELAERIARIWAMVAELDPELARRWSDYEDMRLGRHPADAQHGHIGRRAPDATSPAPGTPTVTPASAPRTRRNRHPERRPSRAGEDRLARARG